MLDQIQCWDQLIYSILYWFYSALKLSHWNCVTFRAFTSKAKATGITCWTPVQCRGNFCIWHFLKWRESHLSVSTSDLFCLFPWDMLNQTIFLVIKNPTWWPLDSWVDFSGCQMWPGFLSWGHRLCFRLLILSSPQGLLTNEFPVGIQSSHFWQWCH